MRIQDTPGGAQYADIRAVPGIEGVHYRPISVAQARRLRALGEQTQDDEAIVEMARFLLEEVLFDRQGNPFKNSPDELSIEFISTVVPLVTGVEEMEKKASQSSSTHG